jgi:hypothetical protein
LPYRVKAARPRLTLGFQAGACATFTVQLTGHGRSVTLTGGFAGAGHYRALLPLPRGLAAGTYSFRIRVVSGAVTKNGIYAARVVRR